jgi:predicted Zn-dependent protease
MLSVTNEQELMSKKAGIDEGRASYQKAVEEFEKLETNDDGKKLVAILTAQVMLSSGELARLAEHLDVTARRFKI